MRRPGRRSAAQRLLGIALLAGATALQAAELWMFTAPGCSACAQFEREVGSLYPRTEEARVLPLRRQQLGARLPETVTLAAPVVSTPTFVLIDQGHEHARIVGYSNDELFWMRLAALRSELPANRSPR